MKRHWLLTVQELLMSEESDLRALATLAGSDPTTFYRGANLSRADLSGQDLTGMDFTGATLDGAIIDSETRIDHKFDPTDYNKPVVKHVVLSKALMDAVHGFEREVNYTYTGSALKALIESGSMEFSYRKRREDWVALLNRNESFLHAIKSESGAFYYRINLRMRYFLFVRTLMKSFSTTHQAYAAAVLIGLISRKMKDNKDYGTVPLSAFYNAQRTSASPDE